MEMFDTGTGLAVEGMRGGKEHHAGLKAHGGKGERKRPSPA
jgi:hypothetical protein